MTKYRPIVDPTNARVGIEYPNYRVGDDGSVWSRRNRVGNRWVDGEWRELLPPVHGDGYRYVTLHPGNRSRKVAVLVCAAFCGVRARGQVCRHLNGDRADDRAANLVWGTPGENMKDRDEHGRTARGERNGFAKLTAVQVRAIKSWRGTESQTATARRFSQEDLRMRSVRRIRCGPDGDDGLHARAHQRSRGPTQSDRGCSQGP